jgi:predicted PurR-regulated permease PerM
MTLIVSPSEPAPAPPRRVTGVEIAAWILTGLGLYLVLYLHLLSALLGGLAVYELVHILSRKLPFIRGRRETGKVVAITLLASVVVAALALATLGLLAYFRSEQGRLPTLLGKVADIIDTSKSHLPAAIADELPTDTEELKNDVVGWLRVHAGELQTVGAELGRLFLHALVGMVIGALVSLGEARPASARTAPLTRALSERASRLGDAFRRIVFAQVRISALNTALTALYLLVVLPLLGVHLPLSKSLIVLTFLAGMLPVVGNLISNSVIVVVSFSLSFGVAIGSLVFLVVIHKLEYFVNAKIVGAEIQARAWELLLVILAMETAFGIAGVVAAPIYYAYLKDELKDRRLI